MLGWSINLFRIFGIQLAVHASFVLLLAYAGWEGWSDGGGWPGMLLNILLTVLFFICVVLHELGHSLTARRYGVKVPRILLMPIGGMAEFDRIPRQPSAEFIITINGPLVNFAIVLILWAAVGLPRGLPWNPQFEDSIKGLAQVLLYGNLIMGSFNLLPVFPMDGGRILRAIFATRLSYLRATFWAARIGQTLAIALACIAVFYWHRPMMAVLFAFIYSVAGAEYKNLLRREQESAYWAEMAKRVAVPVQSSDDDEPPIAPPRILHGPN